ncbi:unnamed protein product [Microthlaspi erraticum]|uniref:Uncharacterized protein n=1 Tax=Microthlaspi erraticum TaxID=1685480 RepID=A0A6D2I1H3_9BRAS|nr:unnamed protein product [Microthlaspi erraticum]
MTVLELSSPSTGFVDTISQSPLCRQISSSSLLRRNLPGVVTSGFTTGLRTCRRHDSSFGKNESTVSLAFSASTSEIAINSGNTAGHLRCHLYRRQLPIPPLPLQIYHRLWSSAPSSRFINLKMNRFLRLCMWLPRPTQASPPTVSAATTTGDNLCS